VAIARHPIERRLSCKPSRSFAVGHANEEDERGCNSLLAKFPASKRQSQIIAFSLGIEHSARHDRLRALMAPRKHVNMGTPDVSSDGRFEFRP
jgi:hypothetical protein